MLSATIMTAADVARGHFLGFGLVHDSRDVGLLHEQELLATDLEFRSGPTPE